MWGRVLATPGLPPRSATVRCTAEDLGTRLLPAFQFGIETSVSRLSGDLNHILKIEKVGIFPHASQHHHSTIRPPQGKEGEDSTLTDDPSRLRRARRLPVSNRQRGADAIASAKDEPAFFCPGAV